MMPMPRLAVPVLLCLLAACSGSDEGGPGVDPDASDVSADGSDATGDGGGDGGADAADADAGGDAAETGADAGDGGDGGGDADAGSDIDAVDGSGGSGTCGDGVVDPGEECDGPTVGATCADLGLGFSLPVCTERCSLDTRPCSRVEVCGDGIQEGTEACDDGNDEPGDGCSDLCVVEVACDPEADTDGDGTNDCDDVEECDGIDNDGDGVVDDAPTDATLGDACYTGPEETEGVGICRAGVLACVVGEIACVGDVTPQVDELCNDLDDNCDGAVPIEEIEAGCSTEVIVTPEPFSARFEIRTPPRAVDVALNLDTTGSMGGELFNLATGLRDVIVPGVVAILPDAAFSFSTFDDFPVSNFGDEGDLPFELRQRVTRNVAAVQAALDAAGTRSGDDTPESGIESLFQIVSGAGTSWPLGLDNVDVIGGSALASLGAELVPFEGSGEGSGALEPYGDVDDYRVSLASGQRLTATTWSSRLGYGLDTVLYLYDADSGEALDENDDFVDVDSFVEYTADAGIDVIVRVASCCGGAPDWGFDTGPYLLAVTVDGARLVPDDGSRCEDLEQGEDATLDAPAADGPAVRLVAAAPAPAPGCEGACGSLADPVLPAEWVAALCDLELDGVCGDGIVGADEECDDGGTDPDDGCSPACTFDFGRVPPFDWRAGFARSEGHGRLGGVGFREGAVPIIVHITDAESHDAGAYLTFSDLIEAHDAIVTLAALRGFGARVVGIASDSEAIAPFDDPTSTDPRFLRGVVLGTESVVPLCAFDGTEARTTGSCTAEQCCTGSGGAGRSPEADGTCPLIFEVSSNGAGISDAIVRGIRAVANFGGEQVGARVVAPLDMPADLACLVSQIEVSDVVRPGDCLPDLELADLDGDGLNETLLNATPSTRAIFSFTVVNRDTRDIDGDDDTSEPCVAPGAYALVFELVDADDDVVFAQRVAVTVED